ncbi:hypothetical protein PSCLAVI8L_230001 [Pseudoclavibacter sp. 8L]|nr:hypothetical protein PSCLAVI8L_230001 [Pseudoclavibacter sp. 8L]
MGWVGLAGSGRGVSGRGTLTTTDPPDAGASGHGSLPKQDPPEARGSDLDARTAPVAA